MSIWKFAALAGVFSPLGRVRSSRFQRVLESAAILPLAAVGQSSATAPRAGGGLWEASVGLQGPPRADEFAGEVSLAGMGIRCSLTDKAAALALTKKDRVPSGRRTS